MIGLTIQNQGCYLYGSPSYLNSFLPINYVVILAGFSIIALVYIISRFLPASMSGKVTSITKVEAVELVISAVIIAMVLLFAATACSISSAISSSVNYGTNTSPLVLSDQYLATLTFNTGLTLLTNIYSYSLSFAIEGAVWRSIANALQAIIPSAPITNFFGPLSFGFPFGYDLGAFYNILSDVFIAGLAPLVIVSLAMLFVQWLSMPIIQATAFVIVLPVAIAMRSFAYAAAGPGLRQTANAVLAIAISAYIVYPLAVSFDPCIVGWIYGQSNCLSSTNPLSQYVSPYTVTSLPPGAFSSAGSSSSQTSAFQIGLPALGSIISSAQAVGLPGLNPGAVLSLVVYLITNIAQFLFISLFLFALDLSIAVAFAMGIARALNAGIEGETKFW